MCFLWKSPSLIVAIGTNITKAMCKLIFTEQIVGLGFYIFPFHYFCLIASTNTTKTNEHLQLIRSYAPISHKIKICPEHKTLHKLQVSLDNWKKCECDKINVNRMWKYCTHFLFQMADKKSIFKHNIQGPTDTGKSGKPGKKETTFSSQGCLKKCQKVRESQGILNESGKSQRKLWFLN